MSVGDIKRLSPLVRALLNDKLRVAHPEDPTVKGISHVMWTGPARDPQANARNAVFYGDAAIDPSPSGTGTPALSNPNWAAASSPRCSMAWSRHGRAPSWTITQSHGDSNSSPFRTESWRLWPPQQTWVTLR